MEKFEEILDQDLKDAVRLYWKTRSGQISAERAGGAVQDQGRRAEVTGGKHLDGFLRIVCEVLKAGGLKHPEVFNGVSDSSLPGFYRPTKRWDLLAVADGTLIACIEVKSQVGPSFGNNFNNRIEEAVGNAHDFWRAYQAGAFVTEVKPMLGFLMLLEDCPQSTSPVGVKEPHFGVLPEFKNTSYADRYRLFCEKAQREGLYDVTAFLMSDVESGLNGDFTEPAKGHTFRLLAASLYGRAVAFCKSRKK
jgi:hypothetical protein